jgi:hypothetical protein
MIFNLWLFLSISVIFITLLIITTTMIVNKTKLKALEIEALKAKRIDIETESEDFLSRQLRKQNDRIEILEAIITNKKYALNKSITNLE